MVLLAESEISGCQRSTMRTSLKLVPLCQTSCSKESSKIMNSPSFQVLISLSGGPTLITGVPPNWGTTSPRWALILQLDGPVWGWTWAFGLMSENLIWNQIKTTCTESQTNSRSTENIKIHWTSHLGVGKSNEASNLANLPQKLPCHYVII